MVDWKQILGITVGVVFILAMVIIYNPAEGASDELTGAYSFKQYFSIREPASLFQEEATKCIYDTTCGEIEGIVIVLPLESGFSTGRGTLSYKCDNPLSCSSGHFEITETKTKGDYFEVIERESFELDVCESRVIKWPTIYCDTCLTTGKIRLLGYKYEPQLGYFSSESVAILELID